MQSLDYNKSSFGVLASNFEEGIRSRAVSSVGGGGGGRECSVGISHLDMLSLGDLSQ